MAEHVRPLLLRDRHARSEVTNEELFFDLIYAFAVTQLSHRLLEHLTLANAGQTLVLWFAVWLGWQYTSWVTNWFNPAHPRMRLMLFALMLIGLVMSAAIPAAFAEAGLTFAICLAAIQIGRAVVVLASLPRGHALVPNFRRILAWELLAASLWIAGGLCDNNLRLGLWIAGVVCEYAAPMLGFFVPGLGRSATSDWTIDGGHLAERTQLFVMIALGESILDTGASFSLTPNLDLAVTLALITAFAFNVAMWWIYFDTASRDGTRAIERHADPGKIGARFHYVHVALVAGIIVCAVGDELMLHHPGEHIDAAGASVLIGGPLLYLAGNALYKRIVYGRLPLSHLVGVLLLLMIAPIASFTDRLMLGALSTLAMIVVAVWQTLRRRQLPEAALLSVPVGSAGRDAPAKK